MGETTTAAAGGRAATALEVGGTPAGTNGAAVGGNIDAGAVSFTPPSVCGKDDGCLSTDGSDT